MTGTVEMIREEKQKDADKKEAIQDKMAEEKENCENFQTCNKPLCFNPADKKCSRCRLVHYCSLQCMKACWPKHKLECRRPCMEGVKVEEREGKGQGLIACRDFGPGEVIIQEDPLLVTVEGEPVQNILKRFDGLQKEEQQLLLALYDPHQPEVPGVEEEKHKAVMRILWANSLQLCSFPELGVAGTALYSTICRINHCCAPNSAWSWIASDPRKRKKVVRAVREVKAGEEITVSYLPSSALFSRRERQASLSNWFPKCACTICARPEDGDEERRNINTAHLEVRSLAKQGRLWEAAEMAKRKVSLMKEIKEEVVQQLPMALLDHSELLALLRTENNIAKDKKEPEKTVRDVLKMDWKETKEYKDLICDEKELEKEALGLAALFGDRLLYRCQKKLERIKNLTERVLHKQV